MISLFAFLCKKNKCFYNYLFPVTTSRNMVMTYPFHKKMKLNVGSLGKKGNKKFLWFGIKMNLSV